MCQPLTRRQLLRLAALAAATPLAARTWRPARAFAQVAARAVPINLELVTLSATAATLTWLTADPLTVDEFGRPEPIPSDTVVELGTSPLSMVPVVERSAATAFHYVELTGLEPGRTYFYRCLSNGLPAAPGQVVPEPPATGVFTTPLPPPGRHLMTMAWMNDLHIGELTSGLAYSNSALPGGGLPPGFAVDPANPYWRVMTRAAVAESRARGAEVLVVNGDLTSESEPVEMAEARALLDGFGSYRRDYWVTRGNHDRAHAGEKWAACTDAHGAPEFDDCLRDEFFPTGETFFSFDVRGLHMVGLDTSDLTTGRGTVSPQQVEWLRSDLAATTDRPSFVFGHHPVSEQARLTQVGVPTTDVLPPLEALALEQAMVGSSVVGVYNAHTHRNWRTLSPVLPDVPFIELGAVKEYPGGYGLVNIYEGGYTVNFHKMAAPDAAAWSERSRGEYLGLYPWYTLGRLSDRNFTVLTDLSDVQPRPAGGGSGATTTTTTAAAPTPSHLPSTGGTALTGAAVAAAAAAAGLAARRVTVSSD